MERKPQPFHSWLSDDTDNQQPERMRPKLQRPVGVHFQLHMSASITRRHGRSSSFLHGFVHLPDRCWVSRSCQPSKRSLAPGGRRVRWAEVTKSESEHFLGRLEVSYGRQRGAHRIPKREGSLHESLPGCHTQEPWGSRDTVAEQNRG